MTTPITNVARQMAADLANAEMPLMITWEPQHFGGYGAPLAVVLARLCQATIDRDKADADRDAKLEAALADLREIDRLLSAAMDVDWLAVRDARAIAARHCETGPLASAIMSANEHLIVGEAEYAIVLRTELAKRGLKIVEAGK